MTRQDMRLVLWSSSSTSVMVVLMVGKLLCFATCGFLGSLAETHLVPPWQSVFSDSGSAIPLFDLDESSTSPVWWLHSEDGAYVNIPATVPGDLISNLWNAGYIDDPYYDINFLTQQHVWMGNLTSTRTRNSTSPFNRQQSRTWIYETNFTLPTTKTTLGTTNEYDDNTGIPSSYSHLLVMEGIKMGATISLNGVLLGTVNNQFVRTIFPIPLQLQEQNPKNQYRLTVTFEPSIDTGGRFMACSGGWDWAPYTRAVDHSQRRIFSFGITKPVYLVPIIGKVWMDRNGIVVQIYPIPAPSSAEPFATTQSQDRDRLRQDFVVQVQVRVYWTTTITKNTTTTAAQEEDDPALALVFQSNFSHTLVRVRLFQKEEEKQKKQQQEHSSSSSSSTTITSTFSSSTLVAVNLTAHQVRLWWPIGLGEQPLYTVKVTLESSACLAGDDVGGDNDHRNASSSSCPMVTKRIGFRDIALITSNLSSSSSDSAMDDDKSDGSGTHGMYFRVNGAVDLWCRGANLIPMHVLEGHVNPQAYKWVVQSAARANMNMLRVWGGGSIPPSHEFYDMCDESGILVYQDLLFVEEDGHGSFEAEIVREEIQQLIRKLSHHPSIVLWSGCNECNLDDNNDANGTNNVYASFVMQTVAQIDDTRAIWPGSPSSRGWASGVFTANGRPNGQPLRIRTTTSNSNTNNNGTMNNNLLLPPPLLEAHGPYQHGYSDTYPGVNGFRTYNSDETHIPPIFRRSSKSSNDDNSKAEEEEEQPVGTAFRNTFVSEFGASVHSSFESMSAFLPPSKWSLHGGGDKEEPPDDCQLNAYGNLNYCTGTNAMAERNYPCDNRIEAYFGSSSTTSRRSFSSLDGKVGPRAFRRQLYLCMMAQALWMKGTIEIFRSPSSSSNTYGTLIWQLNEIWPTGGWGCIEYYGMSGGGGGGGTGSGGHQHQQFGRWKPLMYLLQSFLFQDVIVACGQSPNIDSGGGGGDTLCYARNDSPEACTVEVVLEAWDLHRKNNYNDSAGTDNNNNKKPLREMMRTLVLPKGRSQKWFSLPAGFLGNDAHVLLISTNATKLADSYSSSSSSSSSSSITTSTSTYLWILPKNLPHDLEPVQFDVRVQFHHPPFDNAEAAAVVQVEITSSALALYVVVSTAVPGHFSDNAFSLRPGETKRLEFEPPPLPSSPQQQYGHHHRHRDRVIDPEEFVRTLHIEHLLGDDGASTKNTKSWAIRTTVDHDDDDAAVVTI